MHRTIVLALVAGALLPTEVRAQAPAIVPVVIAIVGAGRVAVRVQIAAGMTTPCDSTDDHMLVDRRLTAGAVWLGSTAAECVCIRNTSETFSRTDWSPSRLACRPRVCRGKRCYPAPDQTIRANLDTRSE
jgi:hypothetical protein